MTVHLDFTEQDETIPEGGPDKCPKCNVEYKVGFGMAGGGYGPYTYCPECGDILSKTQESL